MAHMIKLKGADKVRIMKEATRELSFYKNDVDRSRSSNNYDLQGRADPIAYMNERLAQCVNYKRKNVVEVCN
uniref:Uncharacterized protein n=1 Tax=uncultured prokaryote TaxID=198431 RepID=A0A0H5Q731_9ZZZZ|nr:hypothetical protein [uncultured prokaryote]